MANMTKCSQTSMPGPLDSFPRVTSISFEPCLTSALKTKDKHLEFSCICEDVSPAMSQTECEVFS